MDQEEVLGDGAVNITLRGDGHIHKSYLTRGTDREGLLQAAINVVGILSAAKYKMGSPSMPMSEDWRQEEASVKLSHDETEAYTAALQLLTAEFKKGPEPQIVDHIITTVSDEEDDIHAELGSDTPGSD